LPIKRKRGQKEVRRGTGARTYHYDAVQDVASIKQSGPNTYSKEADFTYYANGQTESDTFIANPGHLTFLVDVEARKTSLSFKVHEDISQEYFDGKVRWPGLSRPRITFS
jgi:hypothetical protein